MLAAFQFALAVTAPIFAIICLGVYLRRVNYIGDGFVQGGANIVFRIALPCLLFTKVSASNYTEVPLAFALYSILILLVCFVIVDRFFTRFFKDDEKGVMVQGILRSNIGITGLAYCLNAFGDAATPVIAIYIAFNIMLINALSVITLNRHHGDEKNGVGFVAMLRLVSTNPLIIAIVLALFVSINSVSLPHVLIDILGYLSRLTLPLALLCVGASIRWNEFRSSKSLYIATVGKLVVFPFVVTAGAMLVGFRGVELGVIFLMAASPTATVSYAMVRVTSGNSHLAAAIVAATALGSMFTTTIGLFVLKSMGYL
ncbi:MAG: AEC family transporter [Desulfotalea sp.]